MNSETVTIVSLGKQPTIIALNWGGGRREEGKWATTGARTVEYLLFVYSMYGGTMLAVSEHSSTIWSPHVMLFF